MQLAANLKNIIDELVTYLERQEAVAVVYLFGSHSKGTQRADSDLDIAILFTIVPTVKELLILRADMVDITAKLDLTILNQASVALRHQVFRYGKTLLLKDKYIDIQLRYTTFREYQDMLDFTGWRDVG